MCAAGSAAFAQHGGGHFGGGGHVGAPRASRPAASRPAAPIRPPLVSPGTRSFLIRPPESELVPSPGFITGYPYPRRPIYPRGPIYPIGILPYPGFGLFGIPFFGLGFGWGSGYGLWGGCDPYWGLGGGYGCNGLPAYDYGSVFSPYSLGPGNPQPQAEIQNWPSNYGGDYSQYVQLYLKDGTIYNVADYWLVNGDLHFKTVEEGGTKVAEHEIDFGQLDLQTTIDVNTQRGFRFVLRNEPLEQYMKDHPSTGGPDEAPAEPGPAGL
jgi:hypothetical protein